jgi:NAD dependent epimerase/dehydratase family enzyme
MPNCLEIPAWDAAGGVLDPGGLRGFDAVVHLVGEPIASGRWTDERKRKIRDSRVGSTSPLAETLARMDDGPRTLVCASASGY